MIHRLTMPTPKSFSFEAMLCESAELPPEGHEWRYELKLDGFRAIGRKSGRSAQLWSRNQKDFTRRFPDVVKGIAGLPSDTVIDGEIVALDPSGKPSFNLLQGLGATCIDHHSHHRRKIYPGYIDTIGCTPC
jgi:bifunctional non-homologous end joining protein LigD